MNVRIRFNNNNDVTVEGVYDTKHHDGYFLCLDENGDKLLAAPEGTFQYIMWDHG